MFNWQVNNSLGKGLSPIGYQGYYLKSMLTKTCHHMASLAHNVSNGHLIRNLHISAVLWPLCISCFKHRWCPTQRVVPNNWLSPSSRWPFTGEFLDKTSNIIYRFPYAIWGPSLTMSFFLSAGMGSGFGSSKQARTKNLKIPLPRGGLAESGILERAFEA